MKWELKKLGEIATFSQGIQVGLEKQLTIPKEGYVRFIRIVDYTQNTDDLRYVENPGEKYFVSEDDIVMVRYGTPGLIGRGKKGVIANNLFKIKITNNIIINDYLALFLSQYKIQNYLRTQGSATMPALNFGQLKTVDIFFPKSLEEQQTIVTKLDQAFAAIDQAKANIEKNIANAKELFQSKLNQIFSQKGEGFIEEKLDNVLIKTKNINPKDFPGKTFRYVDVSAVDRNKLEITEFSEINSDNAPSRARKLILENDVIFATVRPTLRRVALIDKNFDSQICSTGYVVLRNNNNKLLPKMIYYYLLTSYFLENIEKLQKGASYPAVTDGEVKSQLINYPKSLETQQQIVTQLDQLQEQTNILVTKYQQKLANLEELKKSILEKAFKGELV